jgi:hypothetical protein
MKTAPKTDDHVKSGRLDALLNSLKCGAFAKEEKSITKESGVPWLHLLDFDTGLEINL